MPQLAWLPRADATPLLVVATGKSLNAFEITPADLAAEDSSARDAADAGQEQSDATPPPADSGQPADAGAQSATIPAG